MNAGADRIRLSPQAAGQLIFAALTGAGTSKPKSRRAATQLRLARAGSPIEAGLLDRLRAFAAG